MENLEIEYKVMINKESFNLLINKLDESISKKIVQENYYFDSEDEILKQKGLSLRIRHLINEDKYIATLKEDQDEGRLEHEFIVKDANTLPEEIILLLNRYDININEIKNVASLKTIRYEFPLLDNLLCFDHSFYYGIEDYELECESSSMEKAKRVIQNILKRYNISYKESSLSKVARAKKFRR